MKSRFLFVLAIAIALGLSSAYGQLIGDYGSAAAGPANWSTAGSWVICVSNGTFAGATPAVSAPTGTENIFIQAGNTITVDAAVAGISGYIKNSGTLTIGAGSLTFTTGTYEHAAATGNIPISTWGTGSTCLITGATGSPGNNDQSFYNFTWNCASQSGNQGINLTTGRVIGGNFTVLHTGTGTQQFRFMNLAAAETKSITINGDLIINNTISTGIVTTSGSGAAGSFANVTIKGNLSISSGTLSGSQNSGISPTFNIEGNVTISGGTLTRGSFVAGLAFNFTKAGTQTFTKTSGTIASVINFTVASGSTLDMGTNVLDGSTGTFTLSSGAGIKIGSTAGITSSGATGNIQVTGTRTFNTAANYEYNGSSAQVTGNGLPATVNNLTSNNASGVTLTAPVTVNGVLTLAAGLLDNSVNQVTLGPSGSVNNTGGSISQAPLPVELTSFTGVARGRTVELQWKTATEINNSGFEIQKNIDGTWNKIGFVDGAGTTNAPQSYSYRDANNSAAKYSYRLKQIDRDGKFTYSNAIEVATTLSADDFKLSQNYPNPFNPTTKFSFAMKNAEQTTVKIFNVVGEEVATLFNEIAQPNQVYTLTFDAKSLSSGMYYYVLNSASRNEVKKMMLLK